VAVSGIKPSAESAVGVEVSGAGSSAVGSPEVATSTVAVDVEMIVGVNRRLLLTVGVGVWVTVGVSVGASVIVGVWVVVAVSVRRISAVGVTLPAIDGASIGTGTETIDTLVLADADPAFDELRTAALLQVPTASASAVIVKPAPSPSAKSPREVGGGVPTRLHCPFIVSDSATPNAVPGPRLPRTIVKWI
jgi:hypothetical protein